MAGGMVAGLAKLAINTGYSCNKSGEAGKINGTRSSFNVKGDGSVIEVQDGSINSGYGSGFLNARKAAFQDRKIHNPLEECGGTDLSFNVEAGGKIVIASGSICSGAFSGDGISQEFFQQYLANPVAPPLHRSTK